MNRYGIDELKLKYDHYGCMGKLVLTVTLSTYVTSDGFAKHKMPIYWNQTFIPHINRRLTYKQKNCFDYDYVIERSPKGGWHYHGLLAFPEDAGKRIWHDGSLCEKLSRDLDTLKTHGKVRPAGVHDSDRLSDISTRGVMPEKGPRMLCINDYLIEPTREGHTPSSWIGYITKTTDYYASWR